ncbi:MAG: MotA/TolQ/ExbB proton channel family protein [Deltaproteobacteria bacterium]|nr:MotA/TolQ/ExbB proton channel family protein [Deltaproteobacteria bacterium]
MITRALGLLGLGASLWVIYEFEGWGAGSSSFRLLHWPAMVLTTLGPISLVFVCFDRQALFYLAKVAFGPSAESRQRRCWREAKLLQQLGNRFYKQGVLALENVNLKGASDFLAKTIDRLAIKMPAKDVYELLILERDRVRNRLIQSLNVANIGVRVTPSLGMLGTILGMVRLLAVLDDPTHLGANMSLALLTTFFGLFFSLIVWTPVQQKLERLLDVELDGYDQTLAWLETLEKRKPIMYFAESRDIPTIVEQAA